MVFKSKSEIFVADERQALFRNLKDGQLVPITLDDFYQEVADVNLLPSVPLEITSHFDNARNVLVYSWYAYEMSAVAEHHVYATIEYALKIRLSPLEKKNNGPGFRHLLQQAVDCGLISDSGFAIYHARHWQTERTPKKQASINFADDQIRCRILIETLPTLRNSLAHGSNYLNTPSNALMTFELARDLINQLFQPEETSPQT